MEDAYWKDLVSTGMRILQRKGNVNAVTVIRNGKLDIENSYYDNWNGGTDYWDIIFKLKINDFISLGDDRSLVEKDILGVLEELHTDDSNRISNVIIKAEIKRFIDWKAIFPDTQKSTIKLIQEEQCLLTDVATGIVSYAGNRELAISYQKRHKRILDIAEKAGFDYPVKANTLDEWWTKIRCMSSYAERRGYISKLFYPLVQMLSESEDDNVIDFGGIASYSKIICKTLEDVNLFIREGKYESAVDRVHTGFYAYLRQLMDKHGINYSENEKLPSLFSKLHGFYEVNIQPPEVSDRIKAVLRSAGGMINAINELRNNNTVAHPNGQLIQKREAQLVVRLVNLIIDYIRDIEDSFL